HSKDPEFYVFLKKLEKLQSILGDNKTVLLLSSHREIFDLLFQPPRPGGVNGTSPPRVTGNPAAGGRGKDGATPPQTPARLPPAPDAQGGRAVPVRSPLSPALLLFLVGPAATAVTQVRPGERAVVRRFGRVLDHRPEPGLYVGLPWGMDRVDRVPIGLVRGVKV